MASQTDHNGTIVIGIDFGTTFTGVAYSYIRADQQASGNIPPVPITLWPASSSSQANSDSPKVPSKISYAREGTTAWGHLARERAEDKEADISWFKLLLLDEKDLQPHLKSSDHVKQARERAQKTGKDAVTVISDFLEKVWDHILEVIIRAWGRQYVGNRRFHVVSTVPAIWQDREMQQMERVLKRAGILNKRPGCADTTHTFISEPEAAALTAIDGFNKLNALKAGQSFIVADLGGGTVDLISFRAKSIEPKLVLEEVVEGEGALCGATFLDQAFLKCIEKKMERKKWRNRNLKSWKQLHERERKRIMEIEWEKGIKRTYYDGQPRYHIDLGAQGDLRPEIVLDKEDLNGIFDSVYNRISGLVDSQVGAILKKTGGMPKFIVLTGGLGRCEYIYRALYQQYKGRIEILFEANDRPWTAVARGAVLSGLAHITNQDQIHSHVSRFSYGWLKWEDFDHRIHNFDDYESHELTSRPMARDQMEWIILRGESVEAQSSHKYAYERFFDIDEVGVLEFSEPLYRSNLALPPKRLAENEAKNDLNGLGESSEFQEHIIIDMETPVPVEKLPRRGGTEFPHRVLPYEVEVNISGSSLIIRATSKGKKIGEKVVLGLSE
ncbi:hypothetical protein F4678DRAFT_483115 [Xylaria arbuscula]|nr:hypothetical protein F4678DRAFT_483115 [Xylaria arbuscula]